MQDLEELFSTRDTPRFKFAPQIRLRFIRLQTLTHLPSGGARSAVYGDCRESSGPRLQGTAVPSSGGDYACFRPDDTAVLDARYMLQEQDGTLILLPNKGFLWVRPCRMRTMTCARPRPSRSASASTTG